MDPVSIENRDLPALARDRVRIGPAPDWIAPCEYDPDFRTKSGGPLTYLLIERQVHAELSQTYVRMATRLETAQAVQHQSQWRLEFEPQSQSVTLHSITIRRGGVQTEHGVFERIQFLRRESSLEGCIVDGWVTLLLLLEDVRPGDVLEWSYTITTQARLLPEYVNSFFALPAGLEVGKYHFSVRHAERRNLRWKSSSAELAPTTRAEDGEVRCSWSGERVRSPELEDCLPGWQLAYPWMQVSDCPDWQTVARAVAAAWRQAPAGEGLARLADEILSFSTDLPAQVNRAIEMVQDEFRYLSVDLELGGQIPAPAETVIRRRYGDCKDLASLLVGLLRALGVSARPVLVNAHWRQAIGGLLPSLGLLNHALVEFELGGEKRWVDATMKCQGGGALKRCVPDFGLGLPLDDAGAELAPVPGGSLPTAGWETKESFVLDTTGRRSQVLLTIRATGVHADELRWEIANQGVDTIARNRLQNCANRFCRATRIGKLLYRDERERNEFVISEAFEIEGFLKQDPASKRFVFNFRSDMTAGMLALPSALARRHPFALPFPCNRVHTVQIDFALLEGITLRPVQVGNEFFTFTLDVLKNCVSPDRMPSHRRVVELAWQEGAIQLLLPGGLARIRGRIDLSPFTAAARSKPATAQGDPAAEADASGGSWLREKLDERRRAQAAVQTTGSTAQAEAETPDPAQRGGEQASHRESSRRHSGHRGRINRKCVLSLCIFLVALAAVGVGCVLGRTTGGSAIAGLLFIFVLLALPGSLALAVLGMRECRRSPHRYTGGKEIAVAVLVVGTLLGLILIPGVISGIYAAVAGASARGERGADRALLRFDANHFVFHAPRAPWVQSDTRAFGRDAVVAFMRPGTIGFVGSVHQPGPGVVDARSRAVEACKAGIRSWTTDSRLVREGEVIHAGLTGWEMETEASQEGNHNYYVDWLLTTSGLGYELVTWGPVSLKDQIKEEAERMCSSFELIGPAGGQP